MSYRMSQAQKDELRRKAKRIPTWKQDDRKRASACKTPGCSEIATGQIGYCYWCGKRRGLW